MLQDQKCHVACDADMRHCVALTETMLPLPLHPIPTPPISALRCKPSWLSIKKREVPVKQMSPFFFKYFCQESAKAASRKRGSSTVENSLPCINPLPKQYFWVVLNLCSGNTADRLDCFARCGSSRWLIFGLVWTLNCIRGSVPPETL